MSKHKCISPDLVLEGERVMRICNACRYCEGFCAVFPAMERRLTFTEQDLNYLANLCHNCTECWYACQYAPPQEFELNFPKTLSEIRMATYEKYVWPGVFSGMFKNNAVAATAITLISLVAMIFIVMMFANPAVLTTAFSDSQGGFYGVMSHHVMVGTFGIVAAFLFIGFVVGFLRFWRDTSNRSQGDMSLGDIFRAVSDTMQLRYLGGGSGKGCAYPYETPSKARPIYHHFTFYGFGLCFAATALGTIFHYGLGWHTPPPIPVFMGGHAGQELNLIKSLPFILGSLGGVGLLIGPLGLLWLKTKRNYLLVDQTQNGMDASFLILLMLTSLSGFLLAYFRETQLSGSFVVLHLGIVMGLFLTMPYGKFVHGIYRFAALIRNAYEERTMPKLGSE